MSFKFNPFTGNLDIAGGGSGGSGTVTSITGGTGLSGGTITTSGTLAVSYGTTTGTAVEGNDTRVVNAVQKTGDTMTGKLTLPASTIASASINIPHGADPTSFTNGDIWLNGSIRYRDQTGNIRFVADLNRPNTFTQRQTISADSFTTDPALKITQLGSGEALRVEDDTNPDATAFVVSNTGRVGVGVAPDATVALKVDATGIKFSDNSIQTTAAVAKTGDTMTGKLNLPASTTSSAGLNLGNGVSPTTSIAGDVFASGNNIFFKGTTGGPYIFAYKNDTNTFLVPQIISTVSPTGDSAPALRITQAGGGEALRVEDQTTPDPTAFVVSTTGRVGVGVAPDASVALSVDTTGIKFGDGTIQTTAAITKTAIRGQVSKMTSGTITIAATGTYQSTGLTATLDATTAVGMTLGTTDLFAVKNTSAATRVLKIYSSMDASSANNETLGIIMAKNGTSIAETECRNLTGSHNFAKLVTNWMITMAPNDEVALFVANHSSTHPISLQRGRVTASFVD